MTVNKRISYMVDGEYHAYRIREDVPRIRDLVKLSDGTYKVKRILWIEDEEIDESPNYRPAVLVDIEKA